MTIAELWKSNPLFYITDKGDGAHSFSGKSYLDRYSFHFHDMKHSDGDVIELGVSWGGSLRLWKDFFSRGKIVGFDNRDLSGFQKSEGRIIVLNGDQSNAEDMNQLSQFQCKLIIDDASHRAEDILFSFEFLWPKVIPGGWYVMEDLRLPLDWGTHHFLEAKFLEIQRRVDRMTGDVQALIHYPMVTMIQKAC